MRTYLYLLLIIGFGLIESSCLQSSFNVQKRFQLNYQATAVGRQFVLGEDSLTINEFKFSASNIRLITEDSTVIGTDGNVDALIFGYTTFDQLERFIVGTPFMIQVNNFIGYEMDIDPVPSDASIVDSDFFDPENNYSLVVRGSYNGINFEWFESPVFDKSFTFERPIEVTNELETLYLLLESDLLDMFTNDDGVLLDPTDDDQKAEIIENMPDHFSMQAGAITNFIL